MHLPSCGLLFACLYLIYFDDLAGSQVGPFLCYLRLFLSEIGAQILVYIMKRVLFATLGLPIYCL
jgi:hypothetical protein